MNILDMPAGPELDRLVAEKVMGWHLAPHPRPTPKVLMCWFNSADEPITPEHGINFSGNIAHAWEVVEKMGARIGLQGPGSYDIGEEYMRFDSWACAFTLTSGLNSPMAFAETAPLAICRAALAAMSP